MNKVKILSLAVLLSLGSVSSTSFAKEQYDYEHTITFGQDDDDNGYDTDEYADMSASDFIRNIFISGFKAVLEDPLFGQMVGSALTYEKRKEFDGPDVPLFVIKGEDEMSDHSDDLDSENKSDDSIQEDKDEEIVVVTKEFTFEDDQVDVVKASDPEFVKDDYDVNKHCYDMSQSYNEIIMIPPQTYSCMNNDWVINFSYENDVFINGSSYPYAKHDKLRQVRLPNRAKHAFDGPKAIYNDSDKDLYAISAGNFVILTDEYMPFAQTAEYFANREIAAAENRTIKAFDQPVISKMKVGGMMLTPKTELRQADRVIVDLWYNTEEPKKYFDEEYDQIEQTFVARIQNIEDREIYPPVNTSDWEKDHEHQRYELSDENHPYYNKTSEEYSAFVDHYNKKYQYSWFSEHYQNSELSQFN